MTARRSVVDNDAVIRDLEKRILELEATLLASQEENFRISLRIREKDQEIDGLLDDHRQALGELRRLAGRVSP